MESEKVKEIKKALECCCGSCTGCPYKEDDTVNPLCIYTLSTNSLAYINELESENERLILQYERVKADSEMNCLELKDRISELENQMCRNEDLHTATEKLNDMIILKQFAQRLKEKSAYSFIFGKKFIVENDIDETLKEFIGE